MHYFIGLALFAMSFVCCAQDKPLAQIDPEHEYLLIPPQQMEYYVDMQGQMEAIAAFQSTSFQKMASQTMDVSTEQANAVFWIRFSIHNTQNNPLFRLQLDDHTIDEAKLYYIQKGSMKVQHSGTSVQFKDRDLYHKNIGFTLSIAKGEILTCLLRCKSKHDFSLKPVLRSIPHFYKHSIIEYTLLGFFYGITCIIVLYNLVCFFILKKKQYLYYLMYMTCIMLYLMSYNGTGFQFFWSTHPHFSFWAEVISSTVGISCLLLFINAYLALERPDRKLTTILGSIVVANLCTIPFQIWMEAHTAHLWIAILLIHVAFGISFWMFRKSGRKSLWFMLSFVIIDIGFIVFGMERLELVSSSLLTVYALYIAINLQFISISISMIQHVKHLGDEKNKALTELLAVADKNQMMRILALKKQMSPHFIFNALNSILQRIMSGNKTDASDYLVKLSKLIRKNLEQSDTLYATLDDELESLKIYLALEAMRLGQSFQYAIEIDPSVHTATAFIPSFIIQPFVENSIWHGLMPKVGDKNVWVRIEKNGRYLTISIEDNGIGRRQSALEKKQHTSTSQGMSLIVERMELLNKKYKVESSIEVLDLYNPEQIATGTKVIIKTNFTNEQLHNSHYSG